MPVKRYAIIRVKTSKYAWQWAVHLRRSGAFYSKFFSDNKYGGEKQSLAAAIVWRDKTAAKNVLTFREFYEQKRSNNTSGVPGVHKVMLAAQPEGSWQAKILLPDGRKLTKSFAIKKFGGKEAFKRAVAARKAMIASLDERLYLKSSTAKKLARHS